MSLFDEIFSYSTPDLYEIKKFMDKHTDMKYYATGDPNQNNDTTDLNEVKGTVITYHNRTAKAINDTLCDAEEIQLALLFHWA